MTKTIEYTGRGIKLPPQIVHDLTRREFLIGAGLIVLAPACGHGGESGDASGETRTIEHALGRTKVPANPRRIVALNGYSTLDYLLALGMEPVGAPEDPGIWLGDRIEGVGSIGGYPPSLERIAALEPDLVIGPAFNAEEVYDELSQIAPTVATPESPEGSDFDFVWDLRFVAGVVGRQERAEELLTDYRRRLEDFRRAMGERLEETEVSVIRFFEDGTVRIEGNDGYVGELLEDAGVRRPAAQRIEEGINVSLERIDLLDGDVIFAYGVCNPELEDQVTDTKRKFQSNPLWQSLEAVQNGTVYEVDTCLWAGGGFLWANLVLGDLEKYLVENNR